MEHDVTDDPKASHALRADEQVVVRSAPRQAATLTLRTDAWYKADVANGGTAIEDPPGVRQGGFFGQLYLTYFRDPDGNKLS